MRQRILIVEDDPSFRKIVAQILTENGYEVNDVSTGKAGFLSASKEKPDLIILDLILPGIKGMDVCRQLKQKIETAGIPILILTGNDRDGQDIVCLDVGADDYLTKPVKSERLLAHCRALLRRTDPDSNSANPSVSVGSLELDYGKKLAVLKGREYPHLTPKEFGILYALALRSPEPMDRTAVYEQVWGMDPPSEGSLKTVDVHVRRIRFKMGWDTDEWLSYVTGRGYRLTALKR